MRTGKIMYSLRTVGVIVAALAVVLLAGQPATAAPAQDTATLSVTSTLKAEGDAEAQTVMADSFCIVTNGYSCVTAPLWVNNGANPHIATLGIPWSAPHAPGVPDPVNSSVIARYLDTPGDPEILRNNKYRGDEHSIWSLGWPAGNYRAELHCRYGCQGATLYFDI